MVSPRLRAGFFCFWPHFLTRTFFFEGEHEAIFSGVTPAWGKSSVWIFQVSPSVLCPQSSRLQLPHLVACGFTAEVECSWLNPPSTLCAPNSAWLTGNPLPSPPTRSHSEWRSSLLWSPQQWVAVKIVLGFSWSHGAGGGRCPLLEESPATCCQEPWLGEASAAPGRRVAAAQMETRSAPRTDCLIYFKIKQMAVVGFV